jgi:hypothetical protein
MANWLIRDLVGITTGQYWTMMAFALIATGIFMMRKLDG